MHPLSTLFDPRSLAILGASNDPNKVGGRPLAFLLKAQWPGRILPVNPGAALVQGVAAYPSLEAIEGSIDAAIIALPAAQVVSAAKACIERGIKALQIFSADIDLGEVVELAGRSGVKVLGPNSLGLFNVHSAYFATFATALDGAWPSAGSIGVATQSGAVGSYFFGMAQARGLAFSHFVATGNEADVDVADCIDFLAQDANTRMIVAAIEGCQDGRKLIDAIRHARSFGKPVLLMKVGVSSAGAQAAATHTGSLAGEDRVFDAALIQAGAKRLFSLEALVDAAYVASVGPMPSNDGLMVITTSGGVGVLSADAAELGGMGLPQISQDTAAAIKQLVPLADGLNPVDTSAAILGDLSVFARISDLALRKSEASSVLLYLAHIPRNPQHWSQLEAPLLALRESYPAMAFVAVGLAGDTITKRLEAQGFAVFTDPSRAVLALAACAAGARLQPEESLSGENTESLASRRLGPGLNTEPMARAALESQGISFAPQQTIVRVEDALQAASSVGYPLVLKIVSPDIAHKSEAGGVKLGITSDHALLDAIEVMQASVKQAHPQARTEGFLLARQLTGGVEMLVGAHHDPVFGPVITVGAGGVNTEVLRDTCLHLAPVTPAQAKVMLQSLRIAPLLSGFRGTAPVDIEALARTVARVSEIAWANPQLRGIELNPVLATAYGAYALDALIDEGV